MPVFFDGQLLITPTVRSVVDDSQMYNQNLALGNVVALIGRSEGGQPGVPLTLRSPSHAKQVLRSGELLTAANKAFSPSAQTRGPSQVLVVRVNPATQATLTLLDGSAGNAIVLTSTDYGLYTNQVKVKVESGTAAGKRLTTQLGDAYYSQDNVARGAFTIRYSGGQASGVMTVSNTQVILQAPSGSTVATIDLATYPTVQQLVDRINTVTGFAATVVTGSANTVTLNGLDAVTTQDVKTADYTARADLQACVDWFNSISEGFLNAARATGATKVPANLAFTYLASGSDGTVTNTEWSDALEALQAVDVMWVVPISADPAIHAMVDTHVQFMSGAGKKERRALVGGDVGVSMANAVLAAAAINSDRTGYCYPGFYDYSAAGVLTLYPPYILAALVAGAFSGLPPGTPLTNKSISVVGLETQLYQPTDTDYAITSGILAAYKSPKGDFRILKSISTWLTDSRYNRVELSCGVAVDFVTRSVRDAIDVFVGAKGSAVTLQAVASRVDSVLRELARPEPAGPEVIVGDRDNPAYRNIQVSLTGDVIRVEFECSPVIPVNYILVTVHAVPYSSRV